MKYLEKLILGSCYGEENTKRVSFLEPIDFTSTTNQQLFSAIKTHGGMIEAIRNRPDLKNYMVAYSTLLGINNPERLALQLLEITYQRCFAYLLRNLSHNTTNRLEASMLKEAEEKVFKLDIFDLSDSMVEYLGSQASEYTKERIHKFNNYRDERAKKAKQIINEHR